MSYVQAAISHSQRNSSSGHSRWLHLCNGLDPVRDGGMVPSILGMTGALGRLGGDVSIVTPTPSRLHALPQEMLGRIKGPETDLEAAVRAAEVVHLHGLWQGHTRRGARTALTAGAYTHTGAANLPQRNAHRELGDR